jgi:uncharacterized protein with beta-barrel porin domain
MGFGDVVRGFAKRGGTGAIALCVAIVFSPWLAVPASAACTVTGSGTQTGLLSGDQITCTGAGNTAVETDNGSSNVTVSIGNGSTATSLNGGVDYGIGFNVTTSSTITILNQAAVASDNIGVMIFHGSGNTINVNAGATVVTTSLGGVAMSIDGSSGNTINIGGTVGDLTPGTYGLNFANGAAVNEVNIASTGLVQSAVEAILLNGAGGSNTINNAGTILSTSSYAILGSNDTDVVINSGAITTGGATAIFLGAGTDYLVLHDGSSITGMADGGGDTDTLVFGGATGGTFDVSSLGVQFVDFEELGLVDGSTWTLTGTTTFAGPMRVQDGTLVVNASMSNMPTTVTDDGTLGGAGTIGALTVELDGTVAPGNSIGTLNVNGIATFQAGSIYAVEVNAAGQSDLLNVSGAAFINGGTVAVTTLPGAFATTTQYTILTSGVNVVGTFDDVTVAGYNPLFFSAALSYDAFTVFLTLNYNGSAFLDVAETQNQKAVAEAMSALGAGAPFVADFVGLTDDQIRLGLDTLSGEVHASLKGVIGTGPSLFASTVRNRLASAFDSNGRDRLANVAKGGPAYRLGAIETDASGDDVSVPVSPFMWLSGAGANGDIDGDGNAAAASSNSRGVFGGIDVPVETNARLGFAAGWSRTDASVADRASSADADAWHVAGTGAAAFGKLRIRGALAYADYDIDTTRTAIIGPDRYTASAGYGGHRVEGLFETGYVLNAWGATLEPYLGGGFSWLRLGSFTETGGGDANLTSGSDTENAPFSVLGLRYAASWNVGGMAVTPSLDVAWRHLFDGAEPTRTLAFASAATPPWTIAGATIGTDAAVVSAGLETLLTQSLSASARYQGEFSGEAETHSVEGGLKLKF